MCKHERADAQVHSIESEAIHKDKIWAYVIP